MLSRLALIAALASAVHGQSSGGGGNGAPTLEQLALVDAQYQNSGLAQAPEAGFGVELKSIALLNVQYSFGTVENGQAYEADQVAEQPTLTLVPAEQYAQNLTASTLYTVMLADANSLGDPSPNYRHYLENSATGSPEGQGDTLEGGNVVTSYAGPGPLPGSGPHRYAWLVFLQPARFEPPQNLSGTAGIGPWNVQEYVQETGLQLIAASFFTVQNGEPTGSVVETEAVNTATLSVSGASSASAAPTSASDMSSSRSSSATAISSSASNPSSQSSQSTPAPTASNPPSSAGKVAVSLGAIFGAVAFVFLA
ncbi:hypothetical protein OIO90_004510 [Microbotryomycetes sp. JL221]|nr:hypothetical protein OIO90_004510 [Microbotryomycetes sp. JL221]